MTNRKPSAALWITVALVALLFGYPLSFGPAVWCIHWLSCEYGGCATANRLGLVYSPLGKMTCYGPDCLAEPLWWYACAGVPDNGIASVPVGWLLWSSR